MRVVPIGQDTVDHQQLNQSQVQTELVAIFTWKSTPGQK